MKKILTFLIILMSIGAFSVFIFTSSPYRQLRPYDFYGRKLPELRGQKTKLVNGRQTIFIQGNNIEESFYIDQLPVTIESYKDCLSSGKCLYEHYRYYYTYFYETNIYNAFPVTFVNWFDAKNYCEAYGGNLPTKQQWEKAAGADYGHIYPWGNDMPNLATSNLDGYYQWHTPAGWLPEGSSPYGVLDMTGNVREWVLDEINEDNDNKVLKGGCNNDSFLDGKIEAYFDHGPTSSGFNRGFRCVYPAN